MKKSNFWRGLFLAFALACGAADAAGPSSGLVDKLFLQKGAGAVARTRDAKFMDMVSVKDYGAKGNGVADDTAAVKKAVDYLVSIGGGTLYFPKGVYLLNGLAGLDTYKNGVLLPDTNGDFTTSKGIRILGDGVETVLKAGSANMIVLRHSRTYSGGENFKIDGASLANVVCLALAPESLTQTTEVVSQSYGTYRNVNIEHCTEGMLLQPGATVAGADSGAFYHNFYGLKFNLNTRAVWMKKDITGNGNRTTRTSFYGMSITRGNTGVQIDGGTEIDFYSPMFEMINTGTSPSATPVAFNYADTNPANIRIFGGFGEQVSKGVIAASPQWVQLFGFRHTATKDASEYSMGAHDTGAVNVSKNGNEQSRLSLGGAGFVSLVADPDQAGVKTLALQLNGADKVRWNAAGSEVFTGSLGTVTRDASGAGISFSRNGGNTISATGAAASLNYQSDAHIWLNAAGTMIATMSAAEYIPRSDLATDFGGTAYRWKNAYAGSVRTGSGTTIETSGTGSPEGVVTAEIGSMFRRIDGAAGSRIYWKSFGSSNTGWVAIL